MQKYHSCFQLIVYIYMFKTHGFYFHHEIYFDLSG